LVEERFLHSDKCSLMEKGEKHGCAPSVRRGRYKLLLGPPGLHWLSELPPSSQSEVPFGVSGGSFDPQKPHECKSDRHSYKSFLQELNRKQKEPLCSSLSPCLFDVDADPSESTNIASQYPDIVAQLRDIIKINATEFLSPSNTTYDEKSTRDDLCKVERQTGYILPIDWNYQAHLIISHLGLQEDYNCEIGNGGRIILVGGVHGCVDELRILLNKAGFRKEGGDLVILLGDMVNLGPQSVETIRFAQEIKVCVSPNIATYIFFCFTLL